MFPKIDKDGFNRIAQADRYEDEDNAHFNTENVQVGDQIQIFDYNTTGTVTSIKPAYIGDPSSKLFTIETAEGTEEFNLVNGELAIIDYYDN